MKVCPVCNNSIADDSVFCAGCGSQVTNNTEDVYSSSVNHQAVNNESDHTAEFDAKDISESKVLCMLAYLSGALGIIIALLANNNSPYLKFHVRQAIKIMVLNALIVLVSTILSITFIVPIVGILCIAVLNVIKYICLFHVFQGKAVDAPIIKSFNFLD